MNCMFFTAISKDKIHLAYESEFCFRLSKITVQKIKTIYYLYALVKLSSSCIPFPPTLVFILIYHTPYTQDFHVQTNKFIYISTLFCSFHFFAQRITKRIVQEQEQSVSTKLMVPQVQLYTAVVLCSQKPELEFCYLLIPKRGVNLQIFHQLVMDIFMMSMRQ